MKRLVDRWKEDDDLGEFKQPSKPLLKGKGKELRKKPSSKKAKE